VARLLPQQLAGVATTDGCASTVAFPDDEDLDWFAETLALASNEPVVVAVQVGL
jgi:hypothetical protein